MKESLAITLIFCILASLVTFPGLVEGNRTRQTYGEYCNKTLKCDSKQWLRCNSENICSCKNEEMIWEYSKKTCVVLAGEKCKFSDTSSEENGLSVKLECTQNAICSSEGICTCDESHYESEEGDCAPRKLHGSHCKRPHECSGELSCVKNVCICNSTSAHFDGEECVGLAGEKCINGKCIKSAYCQSTTGYAEDGKLSFDSSYFSSWFSSSTMAYYGDQQEPDYKDRLMIKKRDIKEGTCKCNESFQQSASKYCVSSYGQRCEFCDEDLNQSCQRSFYEVMPICKCRDGEHQEYDVEQKKCLSLVNGMCIFDNDCVRNSICKHSNSIDYSSDLLSAHQQNLQKYHEHQDLQHQKNNVEDPAGGNKHERTHGSCQCKKGYVEGPNGKCDLSYGSHCNNNQNYSDGEITSALDYCDRAGFLVCENSVCSCGDRNKEFDWERRKCVGLVGSRCFSEYDYCTGNSSCTVRVYGILGSCECDQGFMRNSERRCEPDLQFYPQFDQEKKTEKDEHYEHVEVN